MIKLSGIICLMLDGIMMGICSRADSSGRTLACWSWGDVERHLFSCCIRGGGGAEWDICFHNHRGCWMVYSRTILGLFWHEKREVIHPPWCIIYYASIIITHWYVNAEERTWTSTPIREHDPESCASAYSATSAHWPSMTWTSILVTVMTWISTGLWMIWYHDEMLHGPLMDHSWTTM